MTRLDISDKITMIDDAFSSYLTNHNDDRLCKDLSDILSAFAGNKRFEVEIVHSKDFAKEPFFGMSIYPSGEYMSRLSSHLTEKETPSFKKLLTFWRHIADWHIEIDSRVFDRVAISFNPQELTAMLLHEIGHTVYSDRKIEMFHRAYMECRIKMTTERKESAKILYFLYQIPLLVACGAKCWRVTSLDLKEEIFADQSVAKLGYGEHLCSAYRKIIRSYGSTSGYSDPVRMQSGIDQSMFWANTNIGDLVHRKNKLKDELYETGSKTGSAYMRKLITGIMNKLSIGTKERYTGNIVMESFVLDFDNPQEYLKKNTLVFDFKGISALEGVIRSAEEIGRNEVATEAFGRKKKKLDIPTQLDVDTIFVEVDRIQNHADRRYVLDLIYHQEERINHFLELCEVNNDLKKKHAGKMNAMLKELEQMRQAVLAKRSFDKQYKVFVKYPSGYEG